MTAEEVKSSIEGLSLEELRDSVLCEMRNKPLLDREACEYLLQAYTDKLAELYF
ncbi:MULTISPECIES: hypothetical protein [unclassified Streptomyces]|uniref:hypothetical protein n=1 Tax=unclassified Streptomyces TaxID=2593676 RepID=UPI000A5CEBB2|nr:MULTISPECIES: hypothetical protein [unclassified Streptomyces]